MVVTPQSTERSVSATVEKLREGLMAQEQTRGEHLARLEQQIAAYEKKYRIPSTEVHQRIEDGLREEDLGVCDWLIALDCLAYERG
jgi:hypothetical protein